MKARTEPGGGGVYDLNFPQRLQETLQSYEQLSRVSEGVVLP